MRALDYEDGENAVVEVDIEAVGLCLSSLHTSRMRLFDRLPVFGSRHSSK